MDEYTIIRIEKVKTRAGLVQRAQHNERTKETPNADNARLGLNQEYVNLTGESILTQLDTRTKEAGVGKPRANATICVEVLMTGGPKADVWQRAPSTAQELGPAADMRESQWAKDAIGFAQKEWGKNLIGLLLHQDEKTPHFQAFVVPIVGAGGGRSGEANPKALTERLPDNIPARRSARDLFTPRRLAKLQTDFAEVMEPHGFKRGIAGSRAHHKSMKEMYGLLEKTATEIVPLVAPVGKESFVLELPPKNPFSHKDWHDRMQTQINDSLERIRGEANAKLDIAGRIAVAAAGGNEAAERSREWVTQEKRRVDKLTEEVSTLKTQLASGKSEVSGLRGEIRQAKVTVADMATSQEKRLDNLALRSVQNTLPPEFTDRGKELWRAERERVRELQEQALKHPLNSEMEFNERMRLAGYRSVDEAGNKPSHWEGQSGAWFSKDKTRPGGPQAPPLADQIAQAMQATRQVELARRQEQLDRDAAHARDLRYKAEYAKLQELVDRLGSHGQIAVRIRVPAEAAVRLVQHVGAGTATADVEPGPDGKTGVNLHYHPSTMSDRITSVIEKSKVIGGEIFEFPDAQDARQKQAKLRPYTGLDSDAAKSNDIEIN